MVREFYVNQVTGLSEQRLQELFQSITPPACLLGGWAVHTLVNQGFQNEHGREYIGSRDIDLGLHIKPEWTTNDLQTNQIGETIQSIQELGYERSRFGFVQYFERNSGQTISEEDASNRPLHQVFPVYIDLIPDTTELSAFHDAFGFTPPAETLLQPVFEGAATPLSNQVSWDIPDSIVLPDTGLLAAMKIRSLPDRDKSHKQAKDLADLHALLWYVTDILKIKQQALQHTNGDNLDQLESTIQEPLIEQVADLLQIDQDLIQASTDRLLL